VDALCDVVGACLALEHLGVDRVFVGPLRLGSGFVRCEHGTLPVPAPGTLECLTGFEVEFDVSQEQLEREVRALLDSLLEEGLIGSDSQGA
jgi:uncharacterized protein (DUF111 family)